MVQELLWLFLHMIKARAFAKEHFDLDVDAEDALAGYADHSFDAITLWHVMRGDLKEAYEWAHKSYDLFKRNSGDNDKSTKLLELYVQALAERIRSDKKLNVQFGED